MKVGPTPPPDLWRMGRQDGRLAAGGRAVVACRVLGLAGMWNTAPGGVARMPSGKPAAFARAAARGASPAAVAAATVIPPRRRTWANAARLAKRGARRAG